ncbi:MAG: tetratricopeptide repeat protein [Anaerolineales bacterium]|nr:tetratricopeptide repeat protein [Anaerolineales bacterium]
MIIEAIVTTTISLIADSLWQEIVHSGVTTQFKERIVRGKISSAIEVSMRDALNTLPGFESEIDETSFIDFLGTPSVSKEILKSISLYEFPNILFLREEWVKKSPRTSAGKAEILLTLFLTRLKKNLSQIPELEDAFFKQKTIIYLSNISGQLNSFQSQLSQFTESSLGPIEGQSKEEIDLQIKVEAYRDIVKKGLPNTALSLLNPFEKSVEEKNLSNKLKSQIQGLIGFCYYLLGNFKEATNRFDRALILDPQSPKALANAALGALLNDKIEEAEKYAKQSLENGGKSTSASAVLVNAQAILRNYKNIEELIDKNFLDNNDYVRALAHIFSHVQDFDNAEKYYRLCLAQNPSDFHSLLGLASILTNNRRYPFRFLAIKAIEESMTLINTAIKEANTGDNETFKEQSLAARSGILLGKGELQAAKIDCTEVLNKNPKNEIALHNQGIISLLEGDFQQAINCFSVLPEEYLVRENLATLLAEAHISNGTFKSAVETADKAIKQKDKEDQIVLISIKAKALIKLNETNDAQKIKDELLATPNSVQAILGAAEIAEIQGNYSESIDILEKGYKAIADSDVERLRIPIILALIYYQHKDFSNSIKWFDLMPREFLGDKALAHKYISALYTAKKYGDAYKALQDARNFGAKSSNLLELESWLAEYFGDRNLAIELQKELVGVEPLQIKHRIQLTRLQFLNNQKDEATSTLNNINSETLDNAAVLIQLGEMYSYIGESTRAIQTAYRARKIGIDTPEIHTSYISLFMRLEDEIKDLLNVDTIAPDTSVLINDGATKRWVKLLLTTKPTNEWEFTLDTEIAKILLGHKKGETVVFKSTPIETLKYTIEEIQSIYVRAFQESLEEFGTRFPNHDGMNKMDISDGDISKIIIPIYRRNMFVDQVLDFYRQGKFPISTVAKVIHASQYEIFPSFQVMKGNRIFASYGSAADQKIQMEAISSAISITLDITGLLTLSHLGFLSILQTRFENIYIHQSMIDEIDELVFKRRFELKNGARYIGYHEGRPYFEETSPTQIDQNIKFLNELRSFLTEKCHTVAISPETASNVQFSEAARESMDELASFLILIAKSTNSPIYTDDAAIRSLANDIAGTSGFWSQILLLDAMNKNIINKDQYESAVAKLIKSNYFLYQSIKI